jgi:hypothetical protein
LEHSEVAVCLLSGTELAFDADVKYNRLYRLFGPVRLFYKVARFRQLNVDNPRTHHDALEFPSGETVLVTRLVVGQRVRCGAGGPDYRPGGWNVGGLPVPAPSSGWWSGIVPPFATHLL